MARPWRRRSPFGELEMVSEYVARHYPNDEARFHVRLGAPTQATAAQLPAGVAKAIRMAFARWADAVVITPTELVVVEGKMRSDAGAISQLELYGDLVPYTPELAEFTGRRTRLELVVCIEDPVVTRMAEARRITVRVYRPSWLPEWIEKRNRRESRPRRPGAPA